MSREHDVRVLCKLKRARAYVDEVDEILREAESNRRKTSDLDEFLRLTEHISALRNESAHARMEVQELNSHLNDKHGY